MRADIGMKGIGKVDGGGSFRKRNRFAVRGIGYNVFVVERVPDARHHSLRVFGEFVQHVSEPLEPLLLILHDTAEIGLFPHVTRADVEFFNTTHRIQQAHMYRTVAVCLWLGHVVHKTAGLFPVFACEGGIDFHCDVLFAVLMEFFPVYIRKVEDCPDVMLERNMEEIAVQLLHFPPDAVWLAVSYVPAHGISYFLFNGFAGCCHE